MTPLLVYLALWLALGVIGEDNISWAGGVGLLLLMTVAPVTALVTGLHVALSGNRTGRAPAGTAVFLLLLIVVLVATKALVVVGAEVLAVAIWYRRQRPA